MNATSECHAVFESTDDVATVTAFYQKKLNSGNWQITSSAGGEIQFRLRNGKRTVAHGRLNIGVSAERTEVTIDVLG